MESVVFITQVDNGISFRERVCKAVVHVALSHTVDFRMLHLCLLSMMDEHAVLVFWCPNSLMICYSVFHLMSGAAAEHWLSN